MQVQFFCPRWGSESIAWNSFCASVKTAGYHGIESSLPLDTAERDAICRIIGDHNLILIADYYQSFEKDFEEHLESYKRHLYSLAATKPALIDAQTGRDFFTFEQNKLLFDTAQTISEKTGIKILHQTHRNKALFAAHIANDFLCNIKNIEITADFSHWCTVAESYLEDQEEALDLACTRARHIHARVGHTQAPQVVDPLLPEWAYALECHTKWWKRIFEVNKQNGAAVLTVTPEFGPAPYMLLSPFNQQPIANQWEINCWMVKYLKEQLL